MAALTPTREEVRRFLAEARTETRATPFGGLDPEGIASLAIVPVWTDALARRVEQARVSKGIELGAFPTGTLTLDEFVRDAQAAGFCQTRDYGANRTVYDEVELLV